METRSDKIQGEKSSMRLMWDQRAKNNAFHYVETTFWNGDIQAFFALGEERARMLIDPMLPALSQQAGFASALEIGCGLGRFSRPLAARFRTVTGVDVSEEMVLRAQQLNPPDQFPNLSFIVSDGVSFTNVRTGSIDFVFSYEVFQHMPSTDIVLGNLIETRRVLHQKGIALIHMKTLQQRPLPTLKERLARTSVGCACRRTLKSLRARSLRPQADLHATADPLKADATFMGTDPLDRNDITTLYTMAGLRVLEIREDPTHEPGTRAFCLATPFADLDES